MFLLDDLLIGSAKGLMGIFKKVYEMAQAEATDDETKIKEELLELQIRFEIGQIDEEEYQKQEALLMERLEAVKEIVQVGT